MDANGVRGKEAEASNTYLMPGQEPLSKKPSKRLAPVVDKVGSAFERFIKTGSADPPVEYADDVYPGTESYHSPEMLKRLKSMSGKGVMQAKTASHTPGHKGNDDPPDDNLHSPVTGEQPKKNPQSGELKPHVDVSAKEPPTLVTEKKAQYWAMPSHDRYPIDSIVQIKAAAAHFDQYRNHFYPKHRREFCVNLVKRAAMVGHPLDAEIHKYGSATYAPTLELEAALEGRKGVLDEDSAAILDKLAALRFQMSPDDFALALGEFDKTAGVAHLYDREIPDPYYSVFGKVASSDETIVIGNDIMSDTELKNFAGKGVAQMASTFGDEMAAEFRKDPRGIFDSLPVDQKKVIIRMATDNAPK